MAVSLPSGVDQRSLLLLLADGRLHSGVRLARALGVDRAAVCEEIERLRASGVRINAGRDGVIACRIPSNCWMPSRSAPH